MLQNLAVFSHATLQSSGVIFTHCYNNTRQLIQSFSVTVFTHRCIWEQQQTILYLVEVRSRIQGVISLIPELVILDAASNEPINVMPTTDNQ
jgi:hypothetical protein